MIYNRLIIVIVTLIVTACGTMEVVVTGEPADALSPEQVEVFYDRVPDCDFSVIAHLQVPGDYYDRERLIGAFKRKAAELGANALHIIQLQQPGAMEYLGAARALRCDS